MTHSLYKIKKKKYLNMYPLCNNHVSDELIRQVTVNCAERGLLLLRVRDEIKMTLAAYQTLYQSSIAFGMRKALQVYILVYFQYLMSFDGECNP